MTSGVYENGNPFPGLRSFEREQAHLFFGRDEQIKDLIARLRGRRFLPIVGVSGSGKSSLVRAGLIPTLTGRYVATKASGWRIAMFRPGRDPMHELAETLCSEFDDLKFDDVLQTLRGSSAGLARVAQQHLGDKEKLLVLVDQFEELFRYREEAKAAGETNDAAAFVKLLLAAAGESEHPLPGFEKLPVFVVTTMRSDFLGKCSSFRGLPEALNHTQYLIPRLTREQQRDAIEGPIGMAGASIEPALVQRLLNDLGDNPAQLPLLQHALMRSWEESAAARAQGKPITVADYEAVGGMADALNRDADRVYASLAIDPVAAAITRRVFQRLVQPGAAEGDTRSPTPLSQLVAVTAGKEEDVKRVINVFRERGFLTVSGDDDPIIDIPHESLIRGWRQLKTWVEEEKESAEIYRRLADQAIEHAKKRASLFIDPQLQLTLDWYKETKPNEAWAARYDSRFGQAMKFLEQSRKERDDGLARAERERRRSLKWARLTALVLGTLLLLAIGASILAVVQWKRTLEERDRSSRLLYDSNMFSASSAVEARQFTLAQDRLNELLDASSRQLRGFEWFYLWRVTHADEATLTGHTGAVVSVVFSPDGKLLASAGDDQTIKLWDIATRREISTLSGHAGAVGSLAFSPDGQFLASASDDDTIKLWDMTTRREIATLSGHSKSVRSVAFSPDGKTLASASNDKTVKLWDTLTRREVATLSGHSEDVSSVAFSRDGKLLASASADKTVKLWDPAGRKEITTLSGHADYVVSIAFSPDGKTLASVSDDNTVKMWDTATRKELNTISGDFGSAFFVTFSPDGATLASSSTDTTIRLWDVTARKETTSFSGHSRTIWSLAFSPDGKILASASADGTVKLWDLAARKDVTTISGHSGAVQSVAFSPDDGNILASGSDDRTLKLWDITTLKQVANIPGHSDSILTTAFSPDGKTLASGSRDKTVKLWDIATLKEVATLSGHSKAVGSVVFSRDGRILASGSADTQIKLWDTTTRKEIATLSDHSGDIWSIAFSPDGKMLASASSDKSIILWDLGALKKVTTLSGHTDYVTSVKFSPDGKILASASDDRTIKFWDIATLKEVATLSGHSGRVSQIAFSPDGKTLASASTDNKVKLWDVATQKEVATLSGHSDNVWTIAFSSDGKTLVSGSADKTVRLWFAATDEEVEERRRRGY